MSEARFSCGNAGRRQLLLEQTAPAGSRLDAIDYLVVVDGQGVPDSLRQRVLLVRAVFGDALGLIDATAVHVEGGVRVRSFVVRWAMPLPDVVAAGGPAVDAAIEPDPLARAWLAARVGATPDAAQWFAVRLAEPGDHSRYTLRAGNAAGEPLPGFDRKLSAVEFSFKVECPTPFDCARESSCPRVPEAAPEIDYLARDFASFRSLMFDRLALLQPAEDVRSAAMLRTAMIEVLAYAADRLAYQQDAVATEAYLDSARLRRSVRRHARLLDYPMHDGCNARAFVHLRMLPGTALGAPGAPALPRGARFWSRVPELVRSDSLQPLPWVDAERVRAVSRRAIAFEAMLPVERVAAARNAIGLHTWGDSECCLAAGATSVTLQDPGAELALAPGDLLLFEETPALDVVAGHTRRDPNPAHRHVVRLTAVSGPYTDDLVGVSVLDVEWSVEDALPFALPVASADGLTTLARGNIVLVDHGRRVAELDVAVASFGRSSRGSLLAETGLTWLEPLTGQARSAAALGRQDPRRAMPQVELVDGDGARWSPVRDLLASDASALEFVVEMEADGLAHLRFGDDRLGRAPAIGVVFAGAEYRVGNGILGNVGADSIVHAVADPNDPLAFPLATALAIESLRNPLPASGGTEPESLEEVKLYAPRAFRRQERAVTAEDWSEVAQRDPEIQRALAAIRWTGSHYTVFLHLDRKGGAELDTDFRARSLSRLERYRLAGHDLELVGPRYVPIDLAASVCVAPGFLRDDVERRLLREFGRGVLADGRLGFFHPDEFTFGQSLFLSRVIARMMAVPGVFDVDFAPALAPGDPPRRFKRWDRPQSNEVNLGRIPVGRFEIVRCDNDPDYPDNGRIQFFMEGGA